MKTEFLPPHIQLAILSREYVLSRAIHAVARLGIADHMSKEPIALNELAKLTATVPELLGRMLDFLSVYGLFTQSDKGFALTELSSPLKANDPFSVKDVLCMVDDSWWEAFSHLETTLKTGKSGFEQQQGCSFFEFLNTHPEKKQTFFKGISQLADYDNHDLIQGFNFGQFKSLVIIGGNNKNLSDDLIQQHPHLSITLCDISSRLNQTDLIKDLPSADAWLLKGVLHDFDEDKVKTFMSTCRNHMNKNTSLLVAEQVMPEENAPHTNRTMDIIMMALTGGRQHHLNDWQKRIESAGFSLKCTYPTKGVFSIMEFGCTQ